VANDDRIDGQRWLLTVAVRMPLNSSGLLSEKIHRWKTLTLLQPAVYQRPSQWGIYGLTLLAVCGVAFHQPIHPQPPAAQSDVLIDFDINDAAVDMWGGAAYSI